MMKKFLSLVVAALLTVSAVATSASAAKFTDVDASNEALNDAVELLVALGVTKGTSEDAFGTDQNVTREQMAAFVYRMMKAGKSVEGGNNVSPFTDLDDPTFYFMISWAASQDIIKGTSATTFNPKGGITLQDAYTMIVRALGYDNGTLAYPIGHINKAEDLGLDENLPSDLNYGDTLTRGNLAIILANMFYAETAETEIRYDADYYFVCADHGKNIDACDEECPDPQVVTSQKPVEYQKTVAEAIFEVEKISQRVIATPNYAFNNAEQLEEDVEMIQLTNVGVVDYADYETSIGAIGTVEFADLGLEGKADDYFLTDILMFVKEIDDGEYEIFGATAQGEKKTVSFDDIEMGKKSGSDKKYYYDGEEKEYKMIDGLLTIDGVKTYIYDAPYSYSKKVNALGQASQAYNARFITLDTFKGDMDEEEYYYNFTTAGTPTDDELAGWVFVDTDEDEVADTWVNNGSYLAPIYFGGLGEVDAYDCNGDGKYEYLFVKNYTVGTIDTEEDAKVEGNFDNTDKADEAIIYTDKSLVEGVEFADEDIVLAYVNAAANYVKVVEVLEGVNATITTAADEYYQISTGEKVYYDLSKIVVTNGPANLSIDEIDDVTNFDDEATYYFAANGKLVYATELANGINLSANWVVVLENEAFESANMVDGKLEKAYYIDIYNDGAIKSVKAKKIITNGSKQDDDTPATVTESKDYDFSAYVNKLATGASDKNGAYYFNILQPVEEGADTNLAGKGEDAEVRVLKDTDNYYNFYQRAGYRYYLNYGNSLDEGKVDVDTKSTVYIKPYTQIIIRSLDEDDNEIVTAYGYDNLPNIKEDTVFTDVSYVLVNNTSSTSQENLAVFYGVVGGELEPAKGELAEIRVLMGNTVTSDEDGKYYTYKVLNPFTGAVEDGVEGVAENGTSYTKGDIFALTTEGYLDDEEAKFGNAFNVATNDGYYDVDEDPANLGFVYVASYDEETGYLEVGTSLDGVDSKGNDIVDDIIDNAIFQVTDETVVSFADKSAGTIKTVDASILGTSSALYKQGEVKTSATRVLLCVEENEDEDTDEETTFYNVVFAMIVRD